MAKKLRKTRAKQAKFEDWQIEFMKNGPPPWEEWKESPHRWSYLDGSDIWERLKQEPDFDENDYPWAVEAYREKF